MKGDEQVDIRMLSHDGYRIVHVDAGSRGYTHIVPPAGEAYAFDRQEWARRLEVSVSPTGRSVRVWVDGQEIRTDEQDAVRRFCQDSAVAIHRAHSSLGSAYSGFRTWETCRHPHCSRAQRLLQP